MKECKYCRTKYDDNLAACPSCGGTKVITEQEKAEAAALYQKEIENRESAVAVGAARRKLLISVLVGIAVVIVAVVALACYNANKPLSNGMTKNEGEALLAEGVAFYDKGDYESAIACFVQLPSDSKQYEEAQSMLEKCENEYSSSIVEKASRYAENGEYEMAINLLNKAGSILPNNAAISTAYNMIFAEYKGIVCSNAHSESEIFASDGDYLSAITAIDKAVELVGHDDELAAKRDVYVDMFVSQTVSAAEAQYIEYNYESIVAAESILKAALNTVPDNEVLLAELANYKEREPVDLLGMETFSGDPRFTVGFIEDTFGNQNDQAYIKATNSGDRQFSYLLNGEYNRLSGTLLWAKEYKNNDRGWYSFMFYSDDRLLYATPQCSAISGPVEFSFDISGVQILTIKIDGFSNKGPFNMSGEVLVQR